MFICKFKKLPWPWIPIYNVISSIICLHLPTFRSQATIVSENPVFTFSYTKAYVIKFDLAVTYVKVYPRSSFEQTMMGWSPPCYIPSFMEIGPLAGSENLKYKGIAAILVIWPASCSVIFISMYLNHSWPSYSRPNRKQLSLYVRNQLAAIHLAV